MRHRQRDILLQNLKNQRNDLILWPEYFIFVVMKERIHNVLCLDKFYVPSQLITWGNAISNVYTGNAVCLDRVYNEYSWNKWVDFSFGMESHDYIFVRTSKLNIAVPEIVVFKKSVRFANTDIKYSRESLFKRDNFTCGYCGKRFEKRCLTVDHIIPRADYDEHPYSKENSNPTHFLNVITACRDCNFKKGRRTPEQAKMPLLFQPKKPKWVNPISGATTYELLPSWISFIDRVNVDIGEK